MSVQEICRVAENTQLGDGLFLMGLHAPKITELAQCGQFVHIACGEGHLLRRPISICAWKAPELRIVFQVKGEGTKWLSERRTGDELDVLGPLGHGFAMAYKHPLIVGGGMGLSPLLYYAAAMQGKADVLMGGKTAEELFWSGLFDDLCGHCFLTTDDGSRGTKGFTTTVLSEILERGDYDVVVTCGPEVMMRGVAKIAREHGIPCEVSLEKRMACGLGACLSCSIDTTDGQRKKVCKDGPVFPAEEVFA